MDVLIGPLRLASPEKFVLRAKHRFRAEFLYVPQVDRVSAILGAIVVTVLAMNSCAIKRLATTRKKALGRGSCGEVRGSFRRTLIHYSFLQSR